MLECPMAFYTFLLLTSLTVLGVSNPTPWAYISIGFIFIGIPLVDFVIGTTKINPSEDEQNILKKTIYWSSPLYLYCLTHFAILYWAGFKLTSQLNWGDFLLTSVVVGMYTGGVGITVAHELCHKKEFIPRTLADLLLSSVCYQHFAVEHVRGHHFRVATPDDPASSRKGESVYAFWIRAVITSFFHACQIDLKSVLRGLFYSVIFAISFYLIGPRVLVFFFLQSFVAFTLLELVDYIEHYGLERKKSSSGRFEKVQVYHSWNSSHRFSNLLLFNLQRHSDHHAYAHLPYSILRHHDEAPQLPSGYPGMILLALIPPLWFKVMDKKVAEFNNKTIIE